MNFIPKDKRARVQSFIAECEEHIKYVLDANVKITVSMRLAIVDEEMIRIMICEKFEVTWAQIISNTKYRNLVNARMCYSYLVRHFLNIPYEEIAKIIMRDHTTVIYHVTTIINFISIADPEICSIINPIIQYLNSINEPEEV